MLSGKVALVTGAGRGIGRAIALTLAGYGADVAVNYSGSKEAAEKTADEIRALGRRAIAVRADISKEEECAELFQRVQQELGVVDILVNNAGITRDGLAVRMTEQEFDAVIDKFEGRIFLHEARRKTDDEKTERQDHQHFFDLRRAGKRRADQLLCGEGRADRYDEMPGKGAGRQKHYSQCGSAGIH